MFIYYCIELYINSFVTLKNDDLKPVTPKVIGKLFNKSFSVSSE